MNKLFISHSSKDKPFVDKLISKLEHLELEFWYDKWEIKVGDSLIDKLSQGLSNSDSVLIILSKNSIVSKWVSEELKYAINRKISGSKINIYPVYIEQCEMPVFLQDIKYADFTNDFKYGLSELLKALLPCENELENKLMSIYSEVKTLLNLEILEWKRLICFSTKIEPYTIDFDTKFINLMDRLVDAKFNSMIKKESLLVVNDSDFFSKFDYLIAKNVNIQSRFWSETASNLYFDKHRVNPNHQKFFLQYNEEMSDIFKNELVSFGEDYISKLIFFQENTLPNFIDNIPKS